MKRFLQVLILFVAVTNVSPAQGDVTQYYGLPGDVMFITGTISQTLEAYVPEVNMSAAGPVFNDEGEYSLTVSDGYPLKSEYPQGADIGQGSMSMSRTEGEDVCWESVSDGDSYYTGSANKCAGLIGWGEYAFVISIAGTEKEFFVSTLDGNWMDVQAYGENKFIFYVDFQQATALDPIEIMIHVYNWGNDQWETVGANDRITFWDLSGVSRERTTIFALGDTPFTIGNQGVKDIDVPFSGLSDSDFDFDVTVRSTIFVTAGATVTITDFEDTWASTYKSSEWTFEASANSKPGLVVHGSLDIFSEDPLINNGLIPRWAVHFEPAALSQTDPRHSWGGILYVDGSSGAVRDAYIRSASKGVGGAPNAVIDVSRCLIDSCLVGIQVDGGRVSARRDTVLHCGTGIRISGSTFAIPRHSLIDSCQIQSNSTNGISLFSNGEPDTSARPEKYLVIRNSEIKFNGGHGIWGRYAIAAVRDCNISRNGWRWGVMPSQITDPVGQGIVMDDTYMNVQSCDFTSNTGYGIYTINDHGRFQAVANASVFGDGTEITGFNCFDGNLVSVFCGPRSKNQIGIYNSYANTFANDRNSLRNPRWRDGGRQINVRVEGATLVEADHNYWLPSTDSWSISQAMNITAMKPIFNADSVRCGAPGYSFPGEISDHTSNETSKTLVRLMRNDSIPAAWSLSRATDSDALPERDAAIHTWVLASARLYEDIDSAQALLEDHAFGSSAYGCTALDVHALLSLKGIYIILGDIVGAWRAYDTLRARLPLEDFGIDSSDVALYRFDILKYIERDTTRATDLIDSLYALYPENCEIRTEYVDMTGDTTAYWAGLGKRTESHEAIVPNAPRIEVVDCRPNPFNPTTTIRLRLPYDATVTFRLYAVDGRLVERIPLGYMTTGIHEFVYDGAGLPSGAYMGIVDDGRTKASFKLLLEK